MYLAEAASLPPGAWRVPNWPKGRKKGRLLLPTKSCARWTMVAWRDASPWWYAVCSETYPANWATLISALGRWSCFLKAANRILRWPGLSPSQRLGMARTLLAIEKWISSLCTNSCAVTSWSGARVTSYRRSTGPFWIHALRFSALPGPLPNASCTACSSAVPGGRNVNVQLFRFRKYSLASCAVLVPRPLKYLTENGRPERGRVRASHARNWGSE
mmetsp:Transcript_3264/g.4733  ORF Transcript_3264/g.4733 Transcript_3264/m.4733 type:complete len:216 (-) Transcript_3264:2276-2923(-)